MPIEFMLMGSGGSNTPVTVTDEGDSAPDSGTSSAQHTYNSKTVNGASRGYVLLSYYSGVGSTRYVTSATWGGTSMTIERQTVTNGGSGPGAQTWGVAILSIDAASASGDVVINFSGIINDSEITIASTDDEYIGTSDTGAAVSTGTAVLSNLNAPPNGGARLAVAVHVNDPTGMTWTNATELSDLDAGSFQHSAAYDEDSNTSDITVASDVAAVGISVR